MINVDKLAGVVLVVNGKILLVQSNKYKDVDNKWSIPKGKINDGENSLDCAIRELEEESGIIITKDSYDHYEIFYKKNGIIKELTAYIVCLDKDELNINLKNNEIDSSYYFTEEINKAKFFNIEEAHNKIQIGQKILLKFIK